MADRSTPVYESGEADRIPAREHEVYNAIAQESDFVELRRRYFSFTVPATIAFLLWYLLYVLLLQLRPRFHEHPGRRPHHRRADLRRAAVRVHLPHRTVMPGTPTGPSTRSP